MKEVEVRIKRAWGARDQDNAAGEVWSASVNSLAPTLDPLLSGPPCQRLVHAARSIPSSEASVLCHMKLDTSSFM